MNNKGKLLNNKGFTLVELLAVVTILVAFSLVAITNTSASLKRNTRQKEDSQKKLLITAAKVYFSNYGIMKVNDVVCVDDLVADKYVSHDVAGDYWGGADKNKGRKWCVIITSSGYSITTSCNNACK